MLNGKAPEYTGNGVHGMIKNNAVIVGRDISLSAGKEHDERFITYLESTMKVKPEHAHAAAKAYMLVLGIKQVHAIRRKKDGALAGWLTMSKSGNKSEGELKVFLLDGYKNRGYDSDAIISMAGYLAAKSEACPVSVRYA